MSVHFFHGDKGGVGKSFVAASFADWLVAKHGINPLVVDADMRNPDLARMFSGRLRTESVDLRVHEGWVELLSILHEAHEREVVVSLPAGVGGEVVDEATGFFTGVRELKREVTLLWVLARTPDSVNLLRPAMATFADHAITMVALRNLFFGEPARFGRWNDSKTRIAFEDAKGIVVDFPDLMDRLVDQTAMANPPVPFSSKLEGLRFGDRMELMHWLEKVNTLWSRLAPQLGVV